MWMTTDGQWKVTRVQTSKGQKLRVSKWSDILGDWERYGHVSSIIQLARYFSLAKLQEFPDVPDYVPEETR